MSDPYLRDIVERNLEVAAQCCIDICHRIITLEGAQKPRSYYEAILRMGELGVLPPDLGVSAVRFCSVLYPPVWIVHVSVDGEPCLSPRQTSGLLPGRGWSSNKRYRGCS
jgi:hypothetical protein